jgi:cysteinyl-tRNA synthetase
MSKSLGNSILVRDIMKQVDTATLRYFMLSTHYRNPLNFSDDSLTQARKSSERIANAVLNLTHRLADLNEHSHNSLLAGEDQVVAQIERILAFFDEKMSDDFNTADAITALFEWVSVTNVTLQNQAVSQQLLTLLESAFERMNQVLGLYRQQEQELPDAEIEQLIRERTVARQTKQWARADDIRDLLTAKGIALEDTPQGVRWKRV